MTDDGRSAYSREFFTAWETFAEQITLVFQYGKEEAKSRPIAVKQTQYVLANMALAKLLKDVGQPEIAMQFHRMAEALQDVVDGTAHPLFKVEKVDRSAPGRRGRQPDTSETWRVRANLCIGIECMMAGGVEQIDAVNFTVKKHRKELSPLLRPGADLRSSILTWLKTFSTDEISNDVALSTYKEGMRFLDVFRGQADPKRFQDRGAFLVAQAAAKSAGLVKGT